MGWEERATRPPVRARPGLSPQAPGPRPSRRGNAGRHHTAAPRPRRPGPRAQSSVVRHAGPVAAALVAAVAQSPSPSQRQPQARTAAAAREVQGAAGQRCGDVAPLRPRSGRDKLPAGRRALPPAALSKPLRAPSPAQPSPYLRPLPKSPSLPHFDNRLVFLKLSPHPEFPTDATAV